MTRFPRLLIAPLCALLLCTGVSYAAPESSSDQWQITSVRICRDRGGNLLSHLEVLGQFPVYSFFIPRPVWTLNGTAVEAQPQYDRGKLVSFTLLYASSLLRTSDQNTVKLSLPDQTASLTFKMDPRRPRNGECYEYF